MCRRQPLSGAVARDWWHEEDHVVNVDIDDGEIELGRRVDGAGAAADRLPGDDASPRDSFQPPRGRRYLGNVDCCEITAGATVILPVAVDGAGLYFGDCKAAMGDGEVVAAPEIGARIVASALPAGAPALDGRAPRAQRSHTDDDRLGELAGRRLPRGIPRIEAVARRRVAAEHDEAALVMGIGAHCGIGQVSNLLHTGKCSISRSLLPESAAP